MADRTVSILINARDTASSVFKKFGGTINSFGSGLLTVGRSVGAAANFFNEVRDALGSIIGPIGEVAMHFAEVGSKLNDMSARTGVGVEGLAELGHAASMTGSSMEDVEVSIKKMQKTITDAANGGKAANEALERIGFTVEDLKGLAPEDQFEAIGNRISEIEDPTRRAATAVEVFGRSGTKLLPMMKDMSALRREARELGIVLSKEQVAAADALGDSMDRAKASIGGVVLQLGSEMAPAITDAADSFSELAVGIGQKMKPAAEELGGLISNILSDLANPEVNLVDSLVGEFTAILSELNAFSADWDNAWELMAESALEKWQSVFDSWVFDDTALGEEMRGSLKNRRGRIKELTGIQSEAQFQRELRGRQRSGERRARSEAESAGPSAEDVHREQRQRFVSDQTLLGILDAPSAFQMQGGRDRRAQFVADVAKQRQRIRDMQTLQILDAPAASRVEQTKQRNDEVRRQTAALNSINQHVQRMVTATERTEQTLARIEKKPIKGTVKVAGGP